jgi:GNAT superfamily N-acetyltransferase
VLIEPADEGDVEGLAALLVDAVEGGASVGFLAGLQPDEARRFWDGALPGSRTWVARREAAGDPEGGAAGEVIGAVQLRPAAMPNGAHRAEVGKLLVRREARGRGVATALMAALEAQALADGRWLLLLDTETGSPAERLYRRLGWQELGVLPDHAARPDGRLAPTTYLFKDLRRP